MSLKTKLTKARKLGIEFPEGAEPSESKIDELIEQKQSFLNQEKEGERIRKAAADSAAEDAKSGQVILKDVDGDDVEQADYFWPRVVAEKIDGREWPATTETAPPYFNKICGMPVDDPDLVEAFVQFFPRGKEFLFYKARGKELYLIIVPLKYATTISRSNESRPGDFQRHAMSFISEGSVNVDSLKLKLARIARHSSISTEPIAR